MMGQGGDSQFIHQDMLIPLKLFQGLLKTAGMRICYVCMIPFFRAYGISQTDLDWTGLVKRGMKKRALEEWTNGIAEETVKFNSKVIRTRCFIVRELFQRIGTFLHCQQPFEGVCFLLFESIRPSKKCSRLADDTILDRNFQIDKFL